MMGQKEVIPATLSAPACGPRAASAGRSHRVPTSGHPAAGPRSPGTPPVPGRRPALRVPR
jgi:hypothetical protein